MVHTSIGFKLGLDIINWQLDVLLAGRNLSIYNSKQEVRKLFNKYKLPIVLDSHKKSKHIRHSAYVYQL